MNDLISKTGVGPFQAGSRLSSADINAINDTLNTLVDTVNMILKGSANINLEEGSNFQKYTIQAAAEKIPESRRSYGMRLFFRDTEDRWGTHTYNGETLDDGDWTNPENWIPNADTGVIDGGEW